MLLIFLLMKQLKLFMKLLGFKSTQRIPFGSPGLVNYYLVEGYITYC